MSGVQFFNLSPVRALLTQAPAGFDGFWFRQVAGAGEYARVKLDAIPAPAAYVVRTAEPAKPMGERLAQSTVKFSVVIVLENTRTDRTASTDDALLAYRDAVATKLLGWLPSPEAEPLRYVGGALLELTENVIYWNDHYELPHIVNNWLPDPAVQFETLEQNSRPL
jgi:hypothetical protein